jgi:crotonobetainyl-CoA:carnitine CoA-transferase CaiB-like acyl-CoA transferase
VSALLSDLRVLAIEQYGAGPFGTMQLADLGADVIKLEDPSVGGDVSRYVPPFQEGESSLFFESFNRNKRSISLDLRHPDARPVLEDLVGAVDVVFSNLRGDQPARLGLRYEDLRHANERIVCVSLSGFGQTGPRVAQGAYDYTMQGLAGWQGVTGEPGGPPVKSGLSLVDYCGGYVAAIAILAGVLRARSEGVGADVDLSLFEVALAQLTYLSTWVASRDYAPVRRPNSAHQSIVPFQNVPTADGWMVVACPKETLWVRLCGALGRPDLSADPRYATFAARAEHREQHVDELAAIFRERTTAEWLALLEPAGVPCAPVNDIAAALADPQVEARALLAELEHPVLGVVRQLASPLRVDGAVPPLRRGPLRGEHTAEVLREACGYSEGQVEQLAASGALGEAG